jgi:hypothetical protein
MKSEASLNAILGVKFLFASDAISFWSFFAHQRHGLLDNDSLKELKRPERNGLDQDRVPFLANDVDLVQIWLVRPIDVHETEEFKLLWVFIGKNLI